MGAIAHLAEAFWWDPKLVDLHWDMVLGQGKHGL